MYDSIRQPHPSAIPQKKKMVPVAIYFLLELGLNCWENRLGRVAHSSRAATP
jgi:hypothetical protein